MTEHWKPCPGFENYYEVSDEGLVSNNSTGNILKPRVNKYGYIRYILCKKGFRKDVGAHQLVCEAFNGSKPIDKDEVNHKDGIKINNTPDNLEWVTTVENIKHAYDLKLRFTNAEKISKGVKQYFINNPDKLRKGSDVSKFLDESQVIEIRYRAKQGESQRKLSKVFGVHEATISDICRRKTWRHILTSEPEGALTSPNGLLNV